MNKLQNFDRIGFFKTINKVICQKFKCVHRNVILCLVFISVGKVTSVLQHFRSTILWQSQLHSVPLCNTVGVHHMIIEGKIQFRTVARKF